MGIHVGSGADYVLVHNILFTGVWAHDLAIMGTQHSVFSRIKGPNLELDHHARGNSFNLFTEVDTGLGVQGFGEASNNFQETYWGIQGKAVRSSYMPESRKCTMVGINADAPTSIGADWHHETVDTQTLVPANIYLAQMAKLPGKYIPADVELTLPPAPFSDKVVKMLPTDDSYFDKFRTANYGNSGSLLVSRTRREGFMKFDLSELNNGGPVYHAKLKLYIRISLKDRFNLRLFNMTNVTWSEETMIYDTRPEGDTHLLSETYLEKADLPDWGWVDLDITDNINNVLSAGETLMSLSFQGGGDGHNKDSIVSIKTKDGSNPSHLVVYPNQPAPAEPLVGQLVPTEDTFFDRWGQPTYGDKEHLLIKKNRREGFVKFDLSELDQSYTNVDQAKLKLYVRVSLKDDFYLQVLNMTDVSWSEDPLTYSNRPFGDTVLDRIYLDNKVEYEEREMDVTDAVNNALAAQESLMSLNLQGGGDDHNKDAMLLIRSKDDTQYNKPPLLQLFKNPEEEHGSPTTPSKPTALVATTEGSTSISLSWDESASDLGPVTYNVYRFEDISDSGGYVMKAMGLTTTGFTDYRLTPGNNLLYPLTYVVTAVDIAGSESMQSENATATSV